MDDWKVFEGTEPYVFISYAHKDSERVIPLIHGLMDRGYRVWYDAGMVPGLEWPTYIAQHLEKSACVIVFLSRNALNSRNCRKELAFALDEGKDPIVILLEDIQWTFEDKGTKMLVGNLHHLYWHRYKDRELFLDDLTDYPILEASKREGKESKRVVGEDLPAETCFYLGIAYESGRGVKLNYKIAAKWYHRAAKQEYLDAYLKLGWFYANGLGVEQDWKKAAQWYAASAERGDVGGQIMLASCYECGTGVEQSWTEAAKWYQKIVDEDAAIQIGVYSDGYWRYPEQYESEDWDAEYARLSRHDQFYELGWLCANGDAEHQNWERALECFLLAANWGNDIRAMVNLGWCYEHGMGTRKNWEEAVKWYRRAAFQVYSRDKTDNEIEKYLITKIRES